MSTLAFLAHATAWLFLAIVVAAMFARPFPGFGSLACGLAVVAAMFMLARWLRSLALRRGRV